MQGAGVRDHLRSGWPPTAPDRGFVRRIPGGRRWVMTFAAEQIVFNLLQAEKVNDGLQFFIMKARVCLMRMVGAKQLGIISRTAIFPCRLCQNWRDGVCVHRRELMIKTAPGRVGIKFLVERQFVRGAGFQLLIVAIVIGLISLIGGVAVHWSGSEG